MDIHTLGLIIIGLILLILGAINFLVARNDEHSPSMRDHLRYVSGVEIFCGVAVFIFMR